MFGCKNNCEHRIKALQERIEELEDQIQLEIMWAEGEVDFWERQVEELEAKLAEKHKPWWRNIIS